MNQNDYQRYLNEQEQHRAWLHREGGHRGDFRKLDLSHANLSHTDLSHTDLSGANLDETGIIAIQGSRHRIVAISRDEVCVGWVCMPLSMWLQEYREVCAKYKYSDRETGEYGEWLAVLDSMIPDGYMERGTEGR